MDKKGRKVIDFPARSSTTDGLVRAELGALFRTELPRLLTFLRARLGSATEAQDAAQTVYLRLWERAGKLNRDNLTGLMFTIARNLATDLLRTRVRHLAIVEPTGFRTAEVLDDAPGADRVVTARHELRLVASLLAELPDKCRIAFVRCQFQGASHEEVAEALGVSESMVRKYLLRATAHCAARFAQLEGWV